MNAHDAPRRRKSKREEQARHAFREKNIDQIKQAHAKNSIRESLEFHNVESGKYIKDIIYGGLDGVITTFAIVSGVAGASLASSIVLVLGFANLIADGFSMAGNLPQFAKLIALMRIF